MKNNGKTEIPETPVRFVSPLGLFSEWMQQGTETFFATQRIILDLVMRQNATAMNAFRERVTTRRPAARAAVAEMASEGVANFIAAQKILLELAKKQNDIVLSGVKERVGVSTPATEMTELLRRSVDTFIDLQKHFVDLASRQTGAWAEAVKTGKPFSGKGLAELAREGLEDFVQSQKRFLNLVAEETGKAAKAYEGPKSAKPTELTELARESVDAFIEAQKRLLDTAGAQLLVNLKAARQTANLLTPLPGTSVAELARQGTQSFVTAQKAILDVVAKPRTPAVHPTVHAKHAAGKRVRVH